MMQAQTNMQLICLLLCSLLTFVAAVGGSPAKHSQQQPPVPVWPDVFTIDYEVLVEDYGENWKSQGALSYHWPNKTFRADYIDWCLPLFDSGPGEFNNYTCSFLATNGSMYFVNHTSPNGVWAENECCLFAEGLAATPPDWMKADQYNGTDRIRDMDVDVWWFPGTNDPNKPCYGYWNRRDEINTPVRFFGLSSIGPTILDYYKFMPGVIMDDIDLSMPLTNCNKECEPPPAARRKKEHQMKATEIPSAGKAHAPWPEWPSCE